MVTKREVLQVIKPPFHYESLGQEIFDSENKLVLDVRGWGYFQYELNGEELQDTWGQMVTDILNKEFNK